MPKPSSTDFFRDMLANIASQTRLQDAQSQELQGMGVDLPWMAALSGDRKLLERDTETLGSLIKGLRQQRAKPTVTMPANQGSASPGSGPLGAMGQPGNAMSGGPPGVMGQPGIPFYMPLPSATPVGAITAQQPVIQPPRQTLAQGIQGIPKQRGVVQRPGAPTAFKLPPFPKSPHTFRGRGVPNMTGD